ncbi:cysteine desulfurase [Candidatus Woesearchaeota archaeon]|nr:cysteine desulfurase [Candidatus Woesearchaeota archaeon]
MIYLDNAATTRLAPEALKSMLPFLGTRYGNPSSDHALGRSAREAVEKAREQLARRCEARPEEIIFTAGGTEANTLALLAAKGEVITTNIEHPSILESCKHLRQRGIPVRILQCDRQGIVSVEQVKRALSRKTSLVSVMHVNNELGTVQPVEDITELCRRGGVLLHVDACQSFGKLPLPDADLVTINAHKLHGPKGTGALIARIPVEPLLRGGGQERGLRAGTENVAGIVGFAAAASLKNDSGRMASLRKRLERGLLALKGVELNGHPEHRAPHIANLAFRGLDGHELVGHLDAMGICVSSGSACSSLRKKRSHVLDAIGRTEAFGALRLSLSRYTTSREISRTVPSVSEVMRSLRLLR